MAATATQQGAALVRIDQLRCTAYVEALDRVWQASDPEAVMAELEPECLEFVELCLLTTMTTGLLADRFRGVSEEVMAARARTIPAPLYERLQAMVREQWGRWRPRREGPAG